MENVTMTWRQFLDYRPTPTPEILNTSTSVDPHDPFTSTPFTPTHPLNPTDFLRQSRLDNGTDIVTRIMNDFRHQHYRSRGLKLKDELPDCRVATERDIESLFRIWFSCAKWMMKELFSLVNGQGVIRVEMAFPSPFGCDANMPISLDEVVVKSLSVEFQRPLVISSHLDDIVADHIYKPATQANGRAMISKIQLSGTSIRMSQVVLTRRLHRGERADVYQGFLDHHPVVYKIYCSCQHEQFQCEVAAYTMVSKKLPDIIPHFYGYFFTQSQSVLVLADAGTFLKGSLWTVTVVQSLTDK
ncbi:hypothetical protein BDP27DRAFT_1423922 [Rhodocollybia butyracea]|uniref:Uncharacterized protein n=1 Tax=Rhodocollybia butyracea TaxID=206335 RepID=A0A9P5PQR6_9AGAR|nr:hypothetical protein BDP27DRAFT_1423922 [Rhodocollybia butyracea]